MATLRIIEAEPRFVCLCVLIRDLVGKARARTGLLWCQNSGADEALLTLKLSYYCSLVARLGSLSLGANGHSLRDLRGCCCVKRWSGRGRPDEQDHFLSLSLSLVSAVVWLTDKFRHDFSLTHYPTLLVCSRSVGGWHDNQRLVSVLSVRDVFALTTGNS